MAGVQESTLEMPLGNGAPQHGERVWADNTEEFHPPALTIAISRETGARGSTIGKRVGKRLGWAFYDQELLQYLAQHASPDDELCSALTSEADAWVGEQVSRVQRDGLIGKDATETAMTRMIFLLAAKGKSIIVGRGAGALLPAQTVLHVRIVAPLPQRVAWIRQLHRFTSEQAAEFIQRQDRRRANVLDTHFRRPSKDAALYDVVLNSSRLGEAACEQLIVAALEQKQEMLWSRPSSIAGAPVDTLD